MKVLLTATSLLPSYGGPAFSVSRLATALAEFEVEVGLWAADQSAPASPLITEGSSVERLAGTEMEALRRFGSPDLLHDNGIWLPHNHRIADLATKRGIPRFVSTRGMLEPWALKHKRAKKRIAWWLYQRWDLKRAHCYHTTAAAEAANVERLGLGVPTRIIPNGVDVPQAAPAGCQGSKTALFLGRIYPVKGLPMLVEAWSRVRPKGWRLQIAGPDEAGHQAEVQKAVSAAGLNDVISFLGELDAGTKHAVLFGAGFFVLPTHSESFGMAVAEALAHGLPVLTTRGAPWPMLPDRGCGWWVDATVDGIAEGLRLATSLDNASLRQMGAKGREFVAAEFGWRPIARQFVTLYKEACHPVWQSMARYQTVGQG
jgi:glycosyltransferase involved in cell wall biosynthesis